MPSYAKLCQVSRMCIKAQNVYQMMRFTILLYIFSLYRDFSDFGFFIHYFCFHTHFLFLEKEKIERKIVDSRDVERKKEREREKET